MSKKVAVCVSGHIRTLYHAFPKSFEIIRSSNSNAKFNFYVSLWDKKDGRVIDKINDPNHYSADMCNSSEMLEKDFIENWLKSHTECDVKVKMLDIKITDSLIQEGKKTIGETDAHLMPQYFSTYECFHMANPEEYDYFVRIRPDIIISDFPNLLNLDAELVTNTDMWYKKPASQGYENEMIWITSGKFAYETADLYESIRKGIHPNGPTYGEAMTGRHFLNVSCKKARFNFNYKVAR